MRSPIRHAVDDELGEVVRLRLEALLAEIPPRRAAQPGPSGSSPATPLVMVAARSEASSGEPSQPDPPDEADQPGKPDDRPVVTKPAQRVAAALAVRTRRFVREHLVVIGLIVLTGCLWGGYSMFQARTSSVALAVPEPSVQVSVPVSSASPTATLLVHVLGEVRRPGVVSLPEGSRVKDAIAAAGGLTRRARPEQLNLAAPVADGVQLLIGRTGSTVNDAATTVSPGSPGATIIDLNAATVEQLDTLPGVGPVTAAKILAWREQHGRFRNVAELQEVDGIGPKSYAEIAPHVRV